MKRRLLFATLFTGSLVGTLPPAMWAQGDTQPVAGSESQAATRVRVVVSAQPDTVLVGQPFTLGVTVQAFPGSRVQFPTLLQLNDELEQRGPAEISPGTRSGQWRAYYPLVGWSSGPQQVPPVEVDVGAGESARKIQSEPYSILVVSVLPAGEEDLELRGARPFMELGAFPWMWILLLLALLAAFLVWYWRRKRRLLPGPEVSLVVTAGARALRELAELRERWDAGEIEGTVFFDRVEKTLRSYAEATRSWVPGRSLRQLSNGNRALSEALNRSALVRFAQVEANGRGPVRAIESCAAWIRSEEPSSPSSDTELAPEPVPISEDSD